MPALFSGHQRKKGYAARIEVAFLDSDSGAPLQDIREAIKQSGWAAIISSTHSHLTTQTKFKRSHWDRFCARSADQDPVAVEFLLKEKHYRPDVAAGARVATETADYVILSHAPCPKFRVAIPLLRPWVAAEYHEQDQANAAWADRVVALASALRLEHDQACIDTSRLFYLPRRPKDGPPPDVAILDGAPCEIFSLPSVTEGARQGSSPRNRRRREKVEPYTDPDTGEVIDLIAWAQRDAGQFEIVAALRARVPDVVLHQVNGGRKHVIRCINEDEHTQAGMTRRP